MRQRVGRHVIGKLAQALEQQIVFNATNVFATAKGTDTGAAGTDLIFGGGLSYGIQKFDLLFEKTVANYLSVASLRMHY